MDNPYKVLGVSPTSSLEEIKIVYRQLSKIYHPDMKTGNEKKFREVNEAWKSIQKLYKEGHNVGITTGMYIHNTLFTIKEVV